MSMTEQDGRNAERQRCIKAVEEFAVDYVNEWVTLQGNEAKAQGWAILLAAAHLRETADTEPRS